jgi:regulator of sigma E protease
MSELFGALGGFAGTVGAFLVALAIIVFVHEYGHYIVGRWSGIRAEVFSLGFGRVLWSRVDARGTRWQVAAVPLGGYVKFAGDSDAASGRDGAAMAALSAEERRHTMHGAPLWARSATVAAGPVFNFVLTFAVFLGVVLWQGVAEEAPVVGEVRATPWEGPLPQPGDRVLSLAGQPTPDATALYSAIRDLPPADTVAWEVERAGERVAFDGPHPFPAAVGFVHSQSAALDAGLREGDVILAVDGAPVRSFGELPPIVGAGAGAPLTLTVWRAGETFEAELTPRRRDLPLPEGGFETRWLIGLNGAPLIDPPIRRAGPLEALQIAGVQTWDLGVTTLSGLWHIVTGAISSCNISGPIGMAEVMGDAARSGVDSFLTMVAVLSLGIGLMNLFPIPVLDGGHLVFHAWEAATGRPPSDRALQVLMTVGLALIAGLMVFALTNDLFCT